MFWDAFFCTFVYGHDNSINNEKNLSDEFYLGRACSKEEVTMFGKIEIVFRGQFHEASFGKDLI